jgi:hypothetical protein
MAVGLFSRWLGCSSTFYAMVKDPQAFDGVRCLLGPQPVTMKVIVQRRLALAGVPGDRIDDLEARIVLRTGIDFAKRAPTEWAKNVCIPTFLYQVHDDVLTDPSDVQTMFDNIPVADKVAPVDPRHYGSVGRLPGVPASPRTDAGVARNAHVLITDVVTATAACTAQGDRSWLPHG